ncbi:MAG: YcnI family protein [Bauldia sp.]
MPRFHFAAAFGAVLAFPLAASAHITLEKQQAAVGGSYKAVFRVPHGCGGSPTVAIRIKIPDGVISVKPQPKPGWKVATVKAAYAKPYKLYGDTLTEGVTEVDFTGGNLPDEFYDEFVVSTYVTADLKPGDALYFPVVQECASGTERWIEIPALGKKAQESERPAPSVTLTPAAGDGD